MNLWNETKSIPISRSMIWNAYKKVRSKKGSAGVDSISMETFDANRVKNLYKLWNRFDKVRVQEQYRTLFYHWEHGFLY